MLPIFPKRLNQFPPSLQAEYPLNRSKHESGEHERKRCRASLMEVRNEVNAKQQLWAIANRLSLRQPQRDSLEILDRVCELSR